MDWDTWRPTYEAILADFGWDGQADAAAARALAAHFDRDAWLHVGTELKHRARAVVVGCGPRLEALRATDLPQGIIVAADGATERLRELGITPRVVVTDLDGDPHSLAWAAAQGASMVVHGHGDNASRFGMLDAWGPLVVGTYQGAPQPDLRPLRNLGGFTDGDRAVLLCEHYQVREVTLVAFDTEAAPSKYSHHFDPATKQKKLRWCRRILEDARERGLHITQA